MSFLYGITFGFIAGVFTVCVLGWWALRRERRQRAASVKHTVSVRDSAVAVVRSTGGKKRVIESLN